MKTKRIGNQNAFILEGNGFRVLQSYDQIVALQSPTGKYYRTDQKWSVTTSKHINRFVGGRANGTPVPQSILDDWQSGDFA